MIIDVIKFLSSSGRMHRCMVKLVNDPRGYSIVSQSDINRYVVQHLFQDEQLKKFGEVQLHELGIVFIMTF
jgi:hypothetical protein